MKHSAWIVLPVVTAFGAVSAPMVAHSQTRTATHSAPHIATQSQKRPVNEHDFGAMTSIGGVQESPDGTTALFTAGGKLMKIATSGGAPQQLAPDLSGFSNIRWSPDGKQAAFIATSSGKQGIWVLTIASGELQRVCDYDISNHFISEVGNMLEWSPDGSKIAFAGTTEPATQSTDPLVVKRIQYKTRTGFDDNRKTHIYVVPASGGKPQAITHGRDDEHSIAWSPDGTEIYFLSNHEPDPDATLNYDIFGVNVDNTKVRRITNTPGTEYYPQVSPDGNFLTYVAGTRKITTKDSVAEDQKVWVVPTHGSAKPRELNAAQDRRSYAPTWTPNGKDIVYTTLDQGKRTIYRVPAAGGKPTALFNDKASVGGVSVAQHATASGIVFTKSTLLQPTELFVMDNKPGAKPKQLTHLNTDFAKKLQLVKPRTVWFKSFDGTKVQGWLYPALNTSKAKNGKAPMLLAVHGGPHGQAEYGYQFNLNFQYNAARGYATLALNPRGSSGYGQKFTDGIYRNWGGPDYKDLMSGVRYIVRTHANTIDRTRLGVYGGSYGGYMTNWIVTQTNMFKAAAAQRSVSNLVSFYGTSLYQGLVHADFGFPTKGNNFALLWRESPLAHIANVKTPLLLTHGEVDHDVPITQAEEMFIGLREQGKTAEFVRYPREGHGLREPAHQQDERERILGWMDKYLSPDTQH